MDQAPRAKLQKALANLGYGSRRALEKQIQQGAIAINHKTAQIGDSVVHGDIVQYQGQNIPIDLERSVPMHVLMYHKPEGEICSSSDPQGRVSVFTKLPPCPEGKWIMVGRLDYQTAGLLLFTNHGQLAHKLMHPSSNILRTYKVRVYGNIDQSIIQELQEGIMLDGKKAKFETIKALPKSGANSWFVVQLSEGRNREVRRLFEHFDIQVNRLIRTHYGPLGLPGSLAKGCYKMLDTKQQQRLEQAIKK